MLVGALAELGMPESHLQMARSLIE
jgi:hypothetical protein